MLVVLDRKVTASAFVEPLIRPAFTLRFCISGRPWFCWVVDVDGAFGMVAFFPLPRRSTTMAR
jgi:hypothetical protein